MNFVSQIQSYKVINSTVALLSGDNIYNNIPTNLKLHPIVTLSDEHKFELSITCTYNNGHGHSQNDQVFVSMKHQSNIKINVIFKLSLINSKGGKCHSKGLVNCFLTIKIKNNCV